MAIVFGRSKTGDVGMAIVAGVGLVRPTKISAAVTAVVLGPVRIGAEATAMPIRVIRANQNQRRTKGHRGWAESGGGDAKHFAVSTTKRTFGQAKRACKGGVLMSSCMPVVLVRP